MKRINVHIREIDKGGRKLTLQNLQEEIVNFLYKDTVANATKSDLLFYVLLFFISVGTNNKTVLESILEKALPKFQDLNKEFASKGRLKRGEYQRLVRQAELEPFFKNDVFFILIEAILNIDDIQKKYDSFLNSHPEIKSEFLNVKEKYAGLLSKSIRDFQSSFIADDRQDERGNYLDLSKSVYRTVLMRTSRTLELNLRKYTSVETITSQSPVDLTFIQYVDIHMLLELWARLHLVEYLDALAKPTIAAIKNHSEFKVNFGELVPLFIVWASTKGVNRLEKRKAREAMDREIASPNSNKALTELTETFVRSILDASLRLEKEVSSLKKQLKKAQKEQVALQDSKAIKKIEERLAKLENLQIETEEDED